MAIYRIRKGPDGTFTVSAQLTEDGVVRHRSFVKGVELSELGQAATKLAEEVNAKRRVPAFSGVDRDVPGETL